MFNYNVIVSTFNILNILKFHKQNTITVNNISFINLSSEVKHFKRDIDSRKHESK